jgi:hypothetical protein
LRVVTLLLHIRIDAEDLTFLSAFPQASRENVGKQLFESEDAPRVFMREVFGYLQERAYSMRTATARASTIITEFDNALAELVGRVVILTDGKAGTVEHIWLDEFHGLRLSIKGHEGRWPVSTIKLAQLD